MNRFAQFLKRERLYILLLIFVVLIGSAVAVSNKAAHKNTADKAKVESKANARDLDLERQAIEKALLENKSLAVIFTVMSLLILAVLLLGFAIDAILLARRAAGKTVDIRTRGLGTVKWGLWDVSKVVILILFFSYMAVIIESLLAKTLPLIKSDDFRTVFNSAIMDGLIIIFVIYFTVNQYKEKLTSLGLAVKNFFRNVFYGVVGYIATLPILFAALILTALVINFFKYVPKEQFVVEVFMRHNNPAFLLYMSIFAAIAGPIVEELFFRGFMYTAVRKYIGVFWATLITASLFAALHAHAIGFFPIMILGIILAYLYEKTGTLVSSMVMHMMHNFSMIALVFLMKAVKGI